MEKKLKKNKTKQSKIKKDITSKQNCYICRLPNVCNCTDKVSATKQRSYVGEFLWFLPLRCWFLSVFFKSRMEMNFGNGKNQTRNGSSVAQSPKEPLQTLIEQTQTKFGVSQKSTIGTPPPHTPPPESLSGELLEDVVRRWNFSRNMLNGRARLFSDSILPPVVCGGPWVLPGALLHQGHSGRWPGQAALSREERSHRTLSSTHTHTHRLTGTEPGTHNLLECSWQTEFTEIFHFLWYFLAVERSCVIWSERKNLPYLYINSKLATSIHRLRSLLAITIVNVS